MNQLHGTVFKKISSILTLLKEYFSVNKDLNPIDKQAIYYICILSGKNTKNLTINRDRVLIAKNPILKIKKAKTRVKIIFCGYKEINKQMKVILKETFPKIKYQILGNKSFKVTNTKTQIKSLCKKFRGNNKMEIIIVSDNWHGPRIRRYLKLYNLNHWQVYTEKVKLELLKIIIEFIKTIKYNFYDDLQI